MGYGREVVRQIVELVRTENATELLTSYVPGEDSPAGFYARLGFVPTGELDPEGEIILRLGRVRFEVRLVLWVCP